MIYILSIVFTLSFVMYSKYQFEELQQLSKGKWHTWGITARILAFVIPFVMQYFNSSWSDYVLAGVINILLFEFLINKVALKKDWFYTGTTSAIDVKYGNKKWQIYFSLLILAILIKIVV